MKKNQIKFGYSDIRLWFAYLITLTVVFIAGLWMGLFGAFIVFGPLLFMFLLGLFGVIDQDATVHEKWQIPVESAVFEAISEEEQRLEKENALLRKNTKIIQEQEKEFKQSKKQKIKGLTKTA
ncbi:hypothetical protein KC950_01750 [Candidatus Saccharibacteria bacterium]|nr:hypothetical protein [Candidatus Saccharibacteria bacterium]